MILYCYRPIESALLEIGKGTLHFVNIYWIKSLYVKRNNKLLRATRRIYCYSV
jgi:hypothetical protein